MDGVARSNNDSSSDNYMDMYVATIDTGSRLLMKRADRRAAWYLTVRRLHRYTLGNWICNQPYTPRAILRNLSSVVMIIVVMIMNVNTATSSIVSISITNVVTSIGNRIISTLNLSCIGYRHQCSHHYDKKILVIIIPSFAA